MFLQVLILLLCDLKIPVTKTANNLHLMDSSFPDSLTVLFVSKAL